MAYEYEPANRDPNRCKASISGEGKYGSFHAHQCSRKPWKDGWCQQHHPDTEAERRKQSEEQYQKKLARSPWRQLQKAHEEIAQQKRLVDELAEVLDAILDAMIGSWFSYTKLPGKIEDAEAEAQKLVTRAYAVLARHQKEKA